MGVGKRSANVRLTLEPLEQRNLLAVDLTPVLSSRLFLANSVGTDEPSAIQGPSSVSTAPSIPANTPPTGVSNGVSTLEDTAYTFTVSDFGFSDPLVLAPPVADGETAANVLVLYNADSTSGIQIANYYAQVHPGVHLLGITGVDPNYEAISADAYLSVIRPQVLAALTPDIDIIVTTKGLPLRTVITEAAPPFLSTYLDSSGNTQTIYAWQQFSSLESELARVDTINSWQMMGDQSYFLGHSQASNPYYLSNAAFSHATFGTRLTSRLDAYTVGDIEGAIDRAQLAMVGPHNSPDGPFYFLVDNDPTKSYGQTMTNLVNNVLIPDGLPLVYDNTTNFVGTAPGPVIGYDSHGVHQASAPPNYLLNGLNVTLANGAVFASWESYNAYSFDPSSTQHSNQGQIGQWLTIGGTAGVGHVEEPGASTNTVTNEDQMFRMLLAGRTFAEAAWSGTRQLSYVNTAVGDPLMTWRTLLSGGGNALQAVKITTSPTIGTLTDDGVAITSGQFVSAADIAAGRLKFAPTSNANGPNQSNFTFQVQDDGGTLGGGSDLDPVPKTMTVNVIAVNDAPAGTNKTITTQQNATYTFTSNDFGYSDPQDGSSNHLAAVKIASLPVAGRLIDNGIDVTAGQFISVTDIASAKLQFVPAAGASGSSYASFTFQVQDDGGTATGGIDLDPAAKTITIDVTRVGQAPTAVNHAYTVGENKTLAVAAKGVLVGATDGDSPVLTAVLVQGAAHGTLTLNANGSFTFVPVAYYSGHDTFLFKVTDGQNDSNVATIDLTITLDQTANTKFLANAYLSLLGRVIDAGGQLSYLSAMANGMSAQAVIQSICNSPERLRYAGTVIDGLYQQVLGRPADPGGRQAWINAMVHGLSREDALAGFLRSGEFAAKHVSDTSFVDAIYRAILGRSESARDRQNWLNNLSHGGTRSAAINSLLHSSEYIAAHPGAFTLS